MHLRKIDLACRKPAAVANVLRAVFGIDLREVGPGCHSGRLGECRLFLCPAETAGVGADAGGVHQLHLACSEPLDDVAARARAHGCRAEEVAFDPAGRQLCVWDPEGHPWVLWAVPGADG